MEKDNNIIKKTFCYLHLQVTDKNEVNYPSGAVEFLSTTATHELDVGNAATK